MNKQLIVIGGGAAGFFGAVNAARFNPEMSVTILEKSREVLSKVRVSGGGRCNVTHHCFDNDDSATIIHCLKEEARKCGVTIRTKTKAESITPKKDGTFEIGLQKSTPLIADFILVASGGYNRSNAYQWLQDLGHSIQNPVPSLFTFNFREKIFSELAGISVPEASVAIDHSSFEYTGPLLITHWGLSGPAVLKTSSWAARFLHDNEYRFDIKVNWVFPDTENEVQSVLKKLRQDQSRKKVGNQNWFRTIPSRLWNTFLEQASINPEKRWAELSNRDVHELTWQLTNGTYTIQGKTTYKEEFVTSGGIPLDEVNFGTMESKKMPGLYFSGEVLDIDGITGGYNFQSAWTTGWIAAQGIADH